MDYNTLKAAVQAAITANGNNEITGNVLQQTLLAIINSLGAGYQFIGTATPSTNPGTPDQNVVYCASETGTYANFGGLTVNANELAFLCYNGSWSKFSVTVPSIDGVVLKTNIVDNVKSSDTDKPLSANQGKMLAEEIGGVTIIMKASTYITTNVSVGDTVNLTQYSSASYASGYADVLPGERVVINGKGGGSPRLWAFLDADNKLLSKSGQDAIGNNLTLFAPANAAKIVVNNTTSTVSRSWVVLSNMQDRYALIKDTLKLSDIVDNLHSTDPDKVLSANQGQEIAKIIGGLTIPMITGAYIVTNVSVGATVSLTPIGSTSQAYAIANVVPGERVFINGRGGGSPRLWAFVDADNKLLSKSAADLTGTNLEVVAPANAAKVIINSGVSYVGHCWVVKINMQDLFALKTTEKIYVNAVTGDDANTGASNAPLRTFQRAFEISGPDLTIIFSGDTTEKINIANAKKRTLSIIGASGTLNRIICGTKIDSATLVTTNVYSVALASFPTANKFQIFQHDIDDANTEILPAERHPLQRGLFYRCGSTLLPRVQTSTEVVNASSPCFAYENGTLYFRIVAGSNLGTNPIYIPSGNGISGNDGTTLFKAINITTLYGGFNLNKSNGAEIIDCSSRYVYGDGCFLWNNAVGIKFLRCEAARAFSGGETGDGFNAHSSVTGNAFAKTTVATMIDCWSHDNNDDGYSDHERCETTIIGGLFEYNTKAGLTPAYGAQDTISGVLCRRQQRGIFYVEATPSSEGGAGGQISVINCLCQDCTNNFVCGNSSATSPENLMLCWNCISYNATNYGFTGGAGTVVKLYNCYHGGTGTPYHNADNVQIFPVNSLQL